ncbi:protoporphyrinogen oxidase [Balneolales bacterium ANBcel1]|nr:protoporphyrinogen oxidase [Balneolales bacterium ANBcel1]
MTRIGIIGGGISGLTIAWLLKKRGYAVRVYESAETPGGAIRTTRDPDGWMAEWGPNTIIESSGRIKKLVAMLELENRRCYPGSLVKKRFLVRDGRLLAAPDSLKAFITSPLLGRSAKLSLLKEPFVARPKPETDRQQHPAEEELETWSRNKPAPATGSPGTSESVASTLEYRDESLAEFVRRRLNDEFLKWPIDALVGGIYAGDPEQLSVRHAFPRLSLLEEQHGSLILGLLKGGVRRPPGSDEIPRNKANIFSFDGGLQVLINALADRLGDNMLTGCTISRIGQAGDKWQIVPEKGSLPEEFDSLVYAGTAHGLSRIALPDSLRGVLQPLTGIPYPPVATLTLGFRRRDVRHPLDGFGMLIPGIEQFPILGTLFTSSLFPGRAPDEEHVTLTTYIGGMRQPELAEKSESEQISASLKSIDALLGLNGDPLFRHRVVWPKAIPQYHTGFGNHLDVMSHVERIHPGFYLAGNYRTGISVGDSINAAFDMAERITKETT